MLRLLGFTLCALFSIYLNAFSMRVIKLINNQEIIIFYASDDLTDKNTINAAQILDWVEKMALVNQEERLEFSYADPGVFDLGSDLPVALSRYKAFIENMDKEQHVVLLYPRPGISALSCLGLRSSNSYIFNDISKVIAQSVPTRWPSNLVMRGNDPRRDYMKAICADDTQQCWLRKHGSFHLLKKTILPSEAFWVKRSSFVPRTDMPEIAYEYLKLIIENSKQAERDQIAALANYLGVKPELLGKNIQKITHKNLDYLPQVYKYLAFEVNINNIYEDIPILDMCLTMFAQDSAQRFISVLSAPLAQKLNVSLYAMDMVIEEIIFDDEEAIKGFFNSQKLEKPLEL